VSYSCSKMGYLRFLDVHPTDYYGCKEFVTTGTKCIASSIFDNEFILYEA